MEMSAPSTGAETSTRFAPASRCFCCVLPLGELPGAFERYVDAEIAPGQLYWVAFRGDRDLAVADIHPLVAGGDLAGKTSVHAVVFKEMSIGRGRAEVIDRNDFDFLTIALVRRPQN
jgi:hypothetical protein